MKTTLRGGGSRRAPSRRASSSTIDVPDALSSAPLWISLEKIASDPDSHSAVAQVVVMAADHDGFIGVWSRPFQHADHVLGLDSVPLDLDLFTQGPALELPGARLQILVDLFLNPRKRGSAAAISSLSAKSRLNITNGRLEYTSVPPRSNGSNSSFLSPRPARSLTSRTATAPC